jgi:hypothetical protein
LLVGIAATGAALAAATFVARGSATTGPVPYVVVRVTLTDSRVVLDRNVVKNVGFVAFRLRNTGKLKHNFVIENVRSPVVTPKHTEHFLVTFADEGKYVYRVTLNGKPGMRGVLKVIAPIPGD